MRRILSILTGAALLAAGSCGRKATPTPPEVHLPPEVEMVYPAPRSAGVSLETDAWAQFAQPLNSSTVNADNVSLRQDAQVVPIQVSWESDTRRLRLRPLVTLAAGRTHTVTLGSELASSEGTPLAQEYSWQFRTTAVSRPGAPQPPSGTVGESPFVTLSWDPVDVGIGTVAYDLYAGLDSLAVARRGGGAIIRVDRPYYLPRSRWSLDRVFYWSVTVVNLTTGESQDGPVWRFATLPTSTPTDSVIIPPSDWGTFDASTNQQSCFQSTFASAGDRLKAAIRWDLRGFAGRKLAAASIQIPVEGFVMVELFPSSDYWPACDIRVPGPPHADRHDFFVAAVPSNRLIDFAAEGLTAHLEAMMRRSGFHGYLLHSNNQMTYLVSRAQLRITMYR